MDIYDEPDGPSVPGSPPDQLRKLSKYWFRTQLTLSLIIGIFCFLTFCTLRRRWRILYAPRTLLKGFSPHEVHDQPAFFGWILPTLRTSEFTVLQLVGLDAVVLLNFLKMGFYYFLTASILTSAILVPINYRENGTSEGAPKTELPGTNFTCHSTSQSHIAPSILSTSSKHHSFANDALHTPSFYNTSHLAFTYFLTLLCLWFLSRYYKRFITTRQLFMLEHSHAVPARTVFVENIPLGLRSERALAEYFEGLGGESAGNMVVESVSVTREVSGLRELLERRTAALRDLEKCWTNYVGNPVKRKVEGWDHAKEAEEIMNPSFEAERVEQERLIETDEEARIPTNEEVKKFVIPNKPRPKHRKTWWNPLSKKVDTLEFLAQRLRETDELVRRRRRGRFRPTETGFVTFENVASAQIAAQVVHYPEPDKMLTSLAPEPKDVNWANVTLSATSHRARRFASVFLFLFLISFWSIPVLFLASLLSYDNIQKVWPQLAEWIDRWPTLQALVQNSLPTLGMVSFNACLPILLDWMSEFQGLQAYSWIEYSLMKKYFIALLFNYLVIFLAVSVVAFIRELADSPMSLLDKLAEVLPGARNFFVSFVMLQALAVLPLQLLQLNVIVPRLFSRMLFARTPRDHGELNVPPSLNLGVVYPQALLVFVVCLVYAIMSPIILFFGALYFGLAYLVYKYKLLFIYYKPYESRGQAWPLAYHRTIWGILIFQIFMMSLFVVQKEFILVTLMLPLMLGTVYRATRIYKKYQKLSKYVNLSQCEEIIQGDANDVVILKKRHPVTSSQSHLERKRYGHTDDAMYIVAKDPRTDFSQPPINEGTLTFGRKRYAHPALFGTLPTPWLPTYEPPPSPPATLGFQKRTEAAVLNLQRQWSRVRKNVTGTPRSNSKRGESTKRKSTVKPPMTASSPLQEEEVDPTRAWRGPESLRSVASSSTSQPEILSTSPEATSSSEDEEMGEEFRTSRYKTYWHHDKSKTMAVSPLSDGESDAEGSGSGINGRRGGTV